MNDFSEYKKMTAPDTREKAKNWGIAIGLQAVDGLTPSKYLIEAARANIEGKITIGEVYKRLDAYYKTDAGKALGADKHEADRVSAHISEILADQSFTFAPTMLFTIHDKLFNDVYPDIAGKVRKYNITKDEDVLNGDTVRYGTDATIADTLKYDFDNERSFDYSGLTRREKAEHIAKFISGIWQTHPFGEGNTRTIAVFAIKYLRAMGFSEVGNELFEENSKYFRNALVRANYQNLEKDVPYATEYLNKFFGNLLLGEKNILKNSDLQIGWHGAPPAPKSEKTRDKILTLISERPGMSAVEMGAELGMSPDTIRDHLGRMKSKGIIRRVGPDKGGQWEIIKT